MSHIFISYSHSDLELAQKVVVMKGIRNSHGCETIFALKGLGEAGLTTI